MQKKSKQEKPIEERPSTSANQLETSVLDDQDSLSDDKIVTDSEGCVLGYLLNNPTDFEDACSAGLCREVLTVEHNKTIFDVMEALTKQSVRCGHAAVAAELSTWGIEKSIPVSELMDMYDSGASISRKDVIDYHIEQLKAAAILRKLKTLGDYASGVITSPGSFNTRLVKAQELIATMGDVSLEHSETLRVLDQNQLADMGKQLIEDLITGDAHIYVPTGIRTFDDRFGGLPKGRITTIAARTSHGKSLVAMDIALRMARSGIGKVLLYSAEMLKEEMFIRAIANIGHMDNSKFTQAKFTQAERDHFNATVQKFRDEYNITMDFTDDPTAKYIFSRALAENAKEEVGLIIFDHLEEMGGLKGSSSGYDMQLKEATSNLDRIAKRLGCPVILVCQLNREIDKRAVNWKGEWTGSSPRVSDIRYADGIAHLSHMILGIYYRYVHAEQLGFNPDIVELTPILRDMIEIHVLKQRGGRLGKVTMSLNADQTRLIDKHDGIAATATTTTYTEQYAPVGNGPNGFPF